MNPIRTALPSYAVLIAALALPAPALAAFAGRAEFVTVGVVAVDAGGKVRALAKGSELNSGDRIQTNAGRAQIRFADGGYVSLQPNTDFAIQNYRFDGRNDGNERGFFTLLKGAMRTVTGAIGKANKANYALHTPTATIGIRGTGGLIEVLADGTTRLTCASGIWTVANQVAMVEVPAGRAVEVRPGVQAPPQFIAQGPVLPPAPIDSGTRQTTTINLATGVVSGDMVRSTGGSTQVLGSGPSYDMSAMYVAPGAAGGLVVNQFQGVGPASFNQIGELTSFTSGGATYSLGATGSVVDAGSAGGTVSWGRWIGGILKNGTALTTLASTDGLHYVIGTPSSLADVTNGTIVTFHLIGGTSPTDGKNTGTLNPNSTLTGYFSAVSPTVGVNLGFSIAGNSYQVQTSTPIPIAGAGGSQTSFNTQSGGALTITGGACATAGCSASIAGQFFGAGATYAGLNYAVASGGGTTLVATGAAAFGR